MEIKEKIERIECLIGKKLSKADRVIIEGYERGYRVIGEVLYNPYGKQLKEEIKENRKNRVTPYITKRVKLLDVNISLHRFIAYQKYGLAVVMPRIVVRHKDGDSLNNIEDNIWIGNSRDNHLDIPRESRVKIARNASNFWKSKRYEGVMELGLEYID